VGAEEIGATGAKCAVDAQTGIRFAILEVSSSGK